jgi:hypothetical protein
VAAPLQEEGPMVAIREIPAQDSRRALSGSDLGRRESFDLLGEGDEVAGRILDDHLAHAIGTVHRLHYNGSAF